MNNDHTIIFLEPHNVECRICCDPDRDYREENVWRDCPGCGATATKYILHSISVEVINRLRAEILALKKEVLIQNATIDNLQRTITKMEEMQTPYPEM